MDKKVYWQDWALDGVLTGMILAIIAMACVTGCDSAPEQFGCGPKVLIFKAEWCHWCPTLEEIVRLQDDHPDYEIVAIDIDVFPEIAAEYRVNKVPRFFLCDEDGCQTTTDFNELKAWLCDLEN